MSGSSRPTSSQRTPSVGGLITGRLESHGQANYQFQAGQSPSYYIKIATNRGIRVLWGKDLARALAESQTQPTVGTLIGVRRTGYDTFTFNESVAERVVRRSRWVVESVQFFANRAQLARRVRDAQLDARRTVKDHPELVSTYLSLRGAEAIAERRIADPKDRERFLALVREAMAKSIKDGQPLPAIRLRERPRQHEQKPPPTGTARRDEPTR